MLFLTPDQIGKLTEVINAHENQRAADVVRLILLTGARMGEARKARLEQFNLDLGIWTKPAATTKQKKMHRVPLSRAAVAFLRTRIATLPEESEWLFPGDIEGQPIENLRRFWPTCKRRPGYRAFAFTICATRSPRCLSAVADRLMSHIALESHHNDAKVVDVGGVQFLI
jgi:integrase